MPGVVPGPGLRGDNRPGPALPGTPGDKSGAARPVYSGERTSGSDAASIGGRRLSLYRGADALVDLVEGLDSDWALPCAMVFLVDVMLLTIYVGMTSRP